MSRHLQILGAGLIAAGSLAAYSAVAATTAAPAAAAPSAKAAPAKARATPKPSCDRACLEGFVDRYIDAMIAKDIKRLPWGDRVKFTENTVPLLVGDGLWGSISARGPKSAEVKVADPATGQVGFYGVVIERDTVPGFLALRLKIENNRIAEVETLVNRQPPPRGGGAGGAGAARAPSTAGVDPMTSSHFPELGEAVKASERTPRAAMVKAADGYFSTLQRNNGRLFTSFTNDCARKENGFLSASGADNSCGGQFKLGRYRYDSAVRDRDYMVVDEERGVVMARVYIDHDATLLDYTLTDGTKASSTYHVPHTLTGLEIFKIKGGKIAKVEVVHLEVPYGTRSTWKQDPGSVSDLQKPIPAIYKGK